MATLPKTPEELLDVVHLPDTSGVFPLLQRLWEQVRGFAETGDIGSILTGLWELIKELLRVAVGLLGALVDLLRSLIGSL